MGPVEDCVAKFDDGGAILFHSKLAVSANRRDRQCAEHELQA